MMELHTKLKQFMAKHPLITGSFLLTLVFGSDTMEFNYEFLSDGVTVQLCRPGTDVIHTWIKK